MSGQVGPLKPPPLNFRKKQGFQVIFKPSLIISFDLLGDGKPGCKGGKGDGECCESDDPENEKCVEGQGDCDKDEGCTGDLVCGKNNCREYHKDAGPKEDCCRKPGGEPRSNGTTGILLCK